MKSRISLIMAGMLALLPSLALSHAFHPLGKVELKWHPNDRITRVLGVNFDFQGGRDFINWDKSARIVEREGRQCVKGAYLLFDIADQYAFNIDEPVTVELTFYRPETAGFIISYDQAIEPMAQDIRFAKDQGNSPWITKSVRLDRARFANRRYFHTDMSLAGLGSQRIHHPDEPREFVLCDLKIKRDSEKPAVRPETGTFTLNILDEKGQPTSARAALYRPDGWLPLTSKDALPVQRFGEHVRELPVMQTPMGWPQNGRYAFYVQDHYAADVPAGDYDVYIMKGPEYHIEKHHITISSGKPTIQTVTLRRWRDLPSEGWISGDDHIHVERETPKENAEILQFMKAEDVHIANLLEAGNLGGYAFQQYAFGDKGHYGHDKHMLVSGQESPRTSHRGHSIGLDTQEFHFSQKEYFLYDKISDAIHKEGGLWGYAHVAVDAFNVRYGLALDVPREKVDFIEVLQYGYLNTAYMYDILNMGFKILPSAGSDYPYLHLPGAERIYVQSGTENMPENWFKTLKSGRSYVTNWLTLDFDINGDKQATEYSLKSGTPIAISAKLRVNPDFDLIDRVELVSQGDVIATASSKDGALELDLSKNIVAGQSTWMVIRAYGKHGGLLHSTPFYFYIDGNRNFASTEKAAATAKKYREILMEFQKSTPKLDEEWERFSVESHLFPEWKSSKSKLDQLIAQAAAVYDKIMAEYSR